VTKQTEVALGEALAALLPHLDEWQRAWRWSGCPGVGVRGAPGGAWCAGGGADGDARHARVGQCAGGPGAGGGAGPKPERLRERDSGLVPALLALVEPDQRGDPESRCAGQ